MLDVPVYIINLDADKDRLVLMDQQLKALAIGYKRFPAINGTDLPDWLKPYFLNGDGSIGSNLRRGEVGCYASHLQLFARVAQNNGIALILEDDLTFNNDTLAILKTIIGLKAKWDIIRLAYGQGRMRLINKQDITEHYKLTGFWSHPTSSGAYLLNPDGAKKFLFWKILRSQPFDIDLGRVWETNMLSYGVSPMPILQNQMSSSIDSLDPRDRAIFQNKKKMSRKEKFKRLQHHIRQLGALSVIKARFKKKVHVSYAAGQLLDMK